MHKACSIEWCDLFFYGVIHQILWSHGGLKNQRFESDLSKITIPVAVIKSFSFALLHESGTPHPMINFQFQTYVVFQHHSHK